MKRIAFSLCWSFVQIAPIVVVANYYFHPLDGEFWWIVAAGGWTGLACQWEERLKEKTDG